ncbi:MAG: MFS transporter, partial [Anaerolineaceae bacterium]
PAMRTSSNLSNTFGWLVGTGPGTGMGLLMILCGIMTALVGISGYLIPAIRNVESIMPDHVQTEPAQVETEASIA